ncbi:MAG: hypothetical protein K8S25_05545 [Alphaproteobacteria bacterium]|nr:hypothetical protein [Alphaproteobacteria bacterium]
MAMNLVAMAIGGFYVFAGVVVLRAMALDRLMGTVLSALENKAPNPNEQWRSALLTAGGYLTLASGASLALLSAFALPIFLANAVVQGGYLLWAERALPPGDEAEGAGRQQTKNAYLLYLAATAFVMWLSLRGGLRAMSPTDSGIGLELLAIGVIVLAGDLAARMPRAWFAWLLAKPHSAEVAAPTNAAVAQPPAMPVNLRLQPDWQCWPLWDADTGENVSHFCLNLADDLAERIGAWDDGWQATYNGDDPPSSGFATEAERDAYRVEGRAIAAALSAVWPGRVEVPDAF